MITIKGYIKECSKDGKKFKVYNAVGKNEDGTAMYGTISFCKEAFNEIAEVERSYKAQKKDMPKMFQFEVPAKNTNVKSRLEYSLNEDGSYRVNPDGEVICYNHTRIYIDGGIVNFTECDTVFEGIGKTAEECFGRG